MVQRRIGGLEKTRGSIFLNANVQRRIGGLEMISLIDGLRSQVQRRIGGLEKRVSNWLYS